MTIDSARLEWLRTPPTLRDLVCDRVSCFETDVPHQFNNSVMAYVTLFTARNRSYMQRVLERENLYFPLFEKYLAQYNLPTDLKYLAVVESALIPTAKSQVGATGLWQFMGPTAGDLRLKRDEWVDERMHPRKGHRSRLQAPALPLRHLSRLGTGAGGLQLGRGQRAAHHAPHRQKNLLGPVPSHARRNAQLRAHLHGHYVQHEVRRGARPAHRQPELPVRRAHGYAGLCGAKPSTCGASARPGLRGLAYLTRFNPELRRAALPAGYRPYVIRYPASAAVHLDGVDRATLLDYCQPPAALPQPLLVLPPNIQCSSSLVGLASLVSSHPVKLVGGFVSGARTRYGLEWGFRQALRRVHELRSVVHAAFGERPDISVRLARGCPAAQEHNVRMSTAIRALMPM